jgi:3-keto-disaccharide hydrolase
MPIDAKTTVLLHGKHEHACGPHPPPRRMGLEGTPFSLSVRSNCQTIGGLVLFFCVFAGSAIAQATDIPAHGSAIVLFDGRDLDQFDTFLPNAGLNSDPNHVFTVEDGFVHVSGTEFGYFITKQEYKNYYLRAEFKWGEGTFAPRQGQARDSGILYNIQGSNKVWPRSIEFQINEGCTGDFWMTDGAALTPIGPDGKAGARVTGPEGKASKVDRFNKGEFKNVTGFRDPTNELEKPHGEWNVVELVNRDGHVWQYVNGKLANEGTDAFPASGRILFQSEGAEVFFRNIKLYPLR